MRRPTSSRNGGLVGLIQPPVDDVAAFRHAVAVAAIFIFVFTTGLDSTRVDSGTTLTHICSDRQQSFAAAGDMAAFGSFRISEQVHTIPSSI